jgi:hypothetical protein
MRVGGTYLLGFGSGGTGSVPIANNQVALLGFGFGSGGTGSVPMANNRLASFCFRFDGFGFGSGGTGSVPIANNRVASLDFRFDGFAGGSGGTGSVPIATNLNLRFDGFGAGGGSGGTGSVPIANKAGFPEVTAFPATARRSEAAVKTTSNASRTVTARFFIEALPDELVVPASRHRHTGEPKLSYVESQYASAHFFMQNSIRHFVTGQNPVLRSSDFL